MMDTAIKAAECTKCHTKDVPLLCCAGCKTPYCSRACQKADWKSHKQNCIPVQAMPARIPSHNTHLDIENHDGKNVLADRDEPTTYKLLIEASRLWNETYRQNRGMMPDPREGKQRYITGYTFKYLQQFITKAEKTGQLPAWWSKEKRAACEKLAKELWHWDDVDAGVPREAWEPGRYGGTDLRLSLRLLATDIEGGFGKAIMNGYLH